MTKYDVPSKRLFPAPLAKAMNQNAVDAPKEPIAAL